MYSVEFTSEGYRSFEKLAKPVRQRVYEKLLWLAGNILSINRIPLHGDFQGLYKLRAGDYRVIYGLDENGGRVIVHLVGHRSEIYEL